MEAGRIEAVALVTCLYSVEAPDGFYDSWLAPAPEQGKDRQSIMSIRQLTDILCETESELFHKYQSQPAVQEHGLEKPARYR